MPQLPSGKHVAVQFDSSIISHLNEPKASSVPWVMALQQPEDLYRWLLVYYLQPDHGGSAINAKEFHSRSSSPPENHLLIPTGMRLSQWEKLTNEWSAEDKKSMRDWMEGPMYECLVQPMLEQAKLAQQWLESSNEFMVKTSVLWWKAGVHYAQEEQWEPDDPEQFDCYDLISALDAFVRNTKKEEPGGRSLNKCIGLWIFMDNLCRDYPMLMYRASDDIRGQASIWRNNEVLGDIGYKKRQSLMQQAIRAAVLFWDGFTDEELRKRNLQAWKIIQLAVISKEADAIFEEKNNQLSRDMEKLP